MSEVASRELRNDTAGVLRRVREGEDVTITINGRAVAMLTALRPQR
ncbi:type II toxin-antitoxin system Phd/YefM family antitoxin, partial [Mycobacterium avium]